MSSITSPAPVASAAPVRDDHPERWRMLVLLAVAELLGMTLWLVGSAVGPLLAKAWSLSTAQVGGLTTAVQLGFVTGTALSAVLNIADVVPSRRLFTIAALASAIANLPLGYTDRYSIALISRFVAGACLAGVYPPAMKMASTWFRARRGLAVGAIVGALTVGKAMPYLAQAIAGSSVRNVTLLASTSSVIAALIVFSFYKDGPYEFPARPFSWSRAGEVLHSRAYRLATGGYLGHMGELYSFWTWIPAFLAASEMARATSHGVTPQTHFAALIGFGVIAVGGIGCIWGGLVADRIGRARLVTWAMAISGSCALLIGAAFGQSWWLMAPIALIWGFFVIADSAQFSALVTESVPPHAVGTALTMQVSMGFLLTTISIQAIPPLVRMFGWQWVFPVLAIGPALGILSIRALRSSR